MLKLLLTSLFTFSFIFRLHANGAPKNLDIYLLIGQSNMAGRAPLVKNDHKAIRGSWLLNKENIFEPVSSPMNRYSTIGKNIKMQLLNPSHSFAICMLKKHQNIGLICNARGGSKIDEWEKDSKYYSEALKRTKEAMKSGKLKGILWHQGESSKDDRDYLKKLENLIADLRKDLGEPKLPFVAGQILQNVSDSGKGKVNEQIAKLPKALKYTAFVSSEGLKDLGDKLHFDNESQKILGTRYAKAVIRLLKED